MSSLHHPHDAAFKSALSDIRVAREFFGNYLPADIKGMVNLNTLRLQDGSFIDQALKASSTDVLYRVQLQCNPAHTGYLYCLAEHQSTPDYWMPLRLIRYLCQILERYRQQHPYTKQLPLIIPLVFYSGQGLYRYSTDFFELFKPHEALAKQLFLGPYRLIDLNQIDDEVLKSHPWSGLMEMLLKHARSRDTLSLLKQVSEPIEKLLAAGASDNYVRSMLYYLLHQGNVNNPDVFFKNLSICVSYTVEQKLMSIAQQLRQEGLQAGLQQGGAAVMTRLLTRRFGSLSADDRKRIEEADPQTLLAWSEKILEAQAPHEVFEE